MHNKLLKRSLLLVSALALLVPVTYSLNLQSASALSVEDLTRIAGATRFETSIATSVNQFPSNLSADIAVIASGRNFPDALSGVSLAALGNGPLLLTEPSYLPSLVAGELVRVLPSGSKVFLLGGEAAISSNVETSLVGLGYTVQRVAGAARYGTSTNIAAEVDHLPSVMPQNHVFIVSGTSFADALSVSPLAVSKGEVLLLTPLDQLSTETIAYLDVTPAITSATIIGGSAVVSGNVHQQLADRGLAVDRIGGTDRYHTSRLIADVFSATAGQPTGVGIASGQNYPDALSAGPDLGNRGFPLLLAQQNNIGCIASGNFLSDYASRIDGGFVYGGSAVISNRTEEYAQLLIAGSAGTGNCDTSDTVNSYSTSCASPFDVALPTDVSKIYSVLYPGQYRGGDYKPHGGFRFDGLHIDDITVTAPFDANVYSGARYLASGEVQYMFDFINACGIRYRLDHLHTLTSKFAAIAATLPQGGEGDSHTTDFTPVQVNQGEVIATAVGVQGNGSTTENVFFDWGMYDLRQTNSISLDPTWSAAHPGEQEQHGVCSFEWLDANTRLQILALPAGDQQSGSQSDYCVD